MNPTSNIVRVSIYLICLSIRPPSTPPSFYFSATSKNFCSALPCSDQKFSQLLRLCYAFCWCLYCCCCRVVNIDVRIYRITRRAKRTKEWTWWRRTVERTEESFALVAVVCNLSLLHSNNCVLFEARQLAAGMQTRNGSIVVEKLYWPPPPPLPSVRLPCCLPLFISLYRETQICDLRNTRDRASRAFSS